MGLEGMLQWDNTIFDEFVIPPELNRENIIDNIRYRSIDMEILFSNPKFLRQAIGAWSALRLPVWEKWLETTRYEYNPIDNYDREETIVIGEGRKTKDSIGRSEDVGTQYNGTESYNSSDTGTVKRTSESSTNNDDTGTVQIVQNGSVNGTTSSHSDSTQNALTSKAAYNATELIDVENVETTGNVSSSGDSTETNNNTSTETRNLHHGETGSEAGDETRDLHGTNSGETTQSGTETRKGKENRTGTETIERNETIKAHGNIGVTSTQQMIQQEREVVAFNVSEIIVEEFIAQFFLLIY